MPKTVLIIDDEMIICLDLQTQLEGLGHRAIIAPTYAEATRIIATEKLDLAILDWHHGGLSGEKFAQALRAKRVPFIFCSGSTQEELVAAFPGVPLVPKPYRNGQLVSALEIAAAQGAMQ